MKILITYSSKTGNTKKVAFAIKEAISDATILPINKVDNFEYDLIFLGGWIDKSKLDLKTLRLIEKLHNKNIAYFFTLGANPSSEHAKKCTQDAEDLLNKKNNVLCGYFCQGAISPKLINARLNLPTNHPKYPSKEKIQRWENAKLHPNDTDLNKAKEFAIKTISILEETIN